MGLLLLGRSSPLELVYIYHSYYLRLAQPPCLALYVSQVLRCEGSSQQAMSHCWSSLTVQLQAPPGLRLVPGGIR